MLNNKVKIDTLDSNTFNQLDSHGGKGKIFWKINNENFLASKESFKVVENWKEKNLLELPNANKK